MIIAISRTILLHRVLPLPRRLSTLGVAVIFTAISTIGFICFSITVSKADVWPVSGPWEPRVTNIFQLPLRFHLGPNWSLLPLLELPQKTNRGNLRQKKTGKNAHDGFSLASSTIVNHDCHLFPPPPSPPCPPPPPPPPPASAPDQSFAGLSITIGLICPRCKSSASECGG